MKLVTYLRLYVPSVLTFRNPKAREQQSQIVDALCAQVIRPDRLRHGLCPHWARKISQRIQRKCHIGFVYNDVSLLRVSDVTRVAQAVVHGSLRPKSTVQHWRGTA